MKQQLKAIYYMCWALFNILLWGFKSLSPEQTQIDRVCGYINIGCAAAFVIMALYQEYNSNNQSDN